MNFLEYAADEHRNFLVSLANFRQEFEAFNHVDGLYQAFMEKAEVPENHIIPMQMLLFTHYQLYSAMAAMLRTHLAEAFNAMRTANEATLQAYRLLEGDGTSEDFVKGIEGEGSFKYTVNRIRKARKKDLNAYPLAEKLITMHESCSRFGAHADFDSFAHRLALKPHGKGRILHLNYFQIPDSKDSLAVFIISMLQSFAYILYVFSDFLMNQVKLVSPDWTHGVEECLRQLDEMKKSLPMNKGQSAQ